MSDPYVLGLDLSLTASGVAAVDGTVHLITPATKGMERIEQIRREVTDFIVPHIELAIIEGYSYASKNQAHQMGEMGGVVRHTLWMAHVPFIEVPPPTLKKFATGNGSCGKYAVIKAACHRMGYEGTDDNEADALWLRAIGWELLGVPACYVPDLNRGAIRALRDVRPVLMEVDR